LRDGVDPDRARGYAPVTGDVQVWGGEHAHRRLHLKFVDLDPGAQAAVLGLDPVRDRDEYATLLDLLEATRAGQPVVTRPQELLGSSHEGARRIGLRARNLGVLDWALWGPDDPSLIEELRHPTSRCTVVDIGSLDTVEEQRLVSEAVLSTLWEQRLERTPTLLVMDEAHNICPADATDAVTGMSTRRAVQIAGEGRKYGLYMLVSTQRPHKVHPDVVSQCDNLFLMRMNSEGDLADIARVFSFVPPGLVHGATGFPQGTALLGGRLFPRPGYVRMGDRLTREGGSDVPTTWAHRG
jgi:DNA helicase HerA-like ATPase